MRRIGIDYWETISQDPKLYCDFTQALIDNLWEVYIISATSEADEKRIFHEISALFIPHTVISVIVCEGEEVISEKLAYAQNYNLDMFIDNREDVCAVLRKHGILTFHAIAL